MSAVLSIVLFVPPRISRSEGRRFEGIMLAHSAGQPACTSLGADSSFRVHLSIIVWCGSAPQRVHLVYASDSGPGQLHRPFSVLPRGQGSMAVIVSSVLASLDLLHAPALARIPRGGSEGGLGGGPSDNARAFAVSRCDAGYRLRLVPVHPGHE